MSYQAEKGAVTGATAGTREQRLLDEVRSRLCAKRYSLRTERAYLGWIRGFILANGKRYPTRVEWIGC